MMLEPVRSHKKDVVILYSALLILWIVFNGKITLEIVAVGAVLSAAVTFMAVKIFGLRGSTVLVPPGALVRYAGYFAALVIEVVRSCLQVMRLVYHPAEEVRPQLVTFRVPLKKEGHMVVLANSITLTPGTITGGVQGDRMRVYALDKSFADGIEDCDFVRRLEKMEEERA